VLPGTRLHDTAPNFGLEYLREIPYTVLASPTFSAADMVAADRLAKATDLFYNQGKAVPWFALVLEALDLAPSELFLRFAGFLDTHEEADVTALQVAFLASCIADPKVAAVAADLVSYFGHSGALLEAAALQPEGTHTRLVSFRHDPQLLLEHLENGVSELDHLAALLPIQPCQARLQVEDGELLLGLLGPDECPSA
jgi:hypothetical protein